MAWAPFDNRIIGAALGSSSRRTRSTHGPVAFTTHNARTIRSSPERLSRSTAPTIRPSARTKLVTDV